MSGFINTKWRLASGIHIIFTSSQPGGRMHDGQDSLTGSEHAKNAPMRRIPRDCYTTDCHVSIYLCTRMHLLRCSASNARRGDMLVIRFRGRDTQLLDRPIDAALKVL